MRILGLVFAALIFSGTPARAQTTFCVEQNIVGVYKGDIGGDVSWGETVIFQDAKGKLGGLYFMHFGSQNVETGHFSELTFTNNRLIGFWSDKYGKGTINFEFSNDCQSFNGLWNGQYQWIGTKTRYTN